MMTDDILIEGLAVDSFERAEGIAEVILLGHRGGVRRIIINDTFGENKQ